MLYNHAMGKDIFKTLCVVFLLAAPQFLSSALVTSEPAAGMTLEARERLISGGDPADEPVRFFITSEDSSFGVDEQNFQGVKIWQIRISDSQNRKVSYIQGVGRPDERPILWNGLSASGKPLPDGFYNASLILADSNGKFRETPEVTVSLVTPLEVANLATSGLGFNYTPEGLVVYISNAMTFSVGNNKIRAEAKPALDSMVAFLKLHPANKIIIRGYTDSTGTREINVALSKRRAFSVYGYFRQNDIDPSRLSYEGLGSSNPVYSNATAEGKTRNRRVEVVVLKTVVI